MSVPAASKPRPQARSGGRARTGAAKRQAIPSADRFADAWDEFVLALRRSQARGQGGRGELTLAQYYLLAQLKPNRELTVCQLADAAGVAAPTATRLVDGLERAGLLRRTRGEADRRTVLVALTDEGRERLQRKQRQIGRRRKLIYERLEPEERRQSEQLLRHLAEVIEHI